MRPLRLLPALAALALTPLAAPASAAPGVVQGNFGVYANMSCTATSCSVWPAPPSFRYLYCDESEGLTTSTTCTAFGWITVNATPVSSGACGNFVGSGTVVVDSLLGGGSWTVPVTARTDGSFGRYWGVLDSPTATIYLEGFWSNPCIGPTGAGHFDASYVIFRKA